MIIDTHFHTGLHKYGPIEDHTGLMVANSISNAVLVQHLGEFDNSYLIEVANRHPGRFAVIAALEPTSTREDFNSLLAEPWFRGLRLAADYRSPGPDPLRIWQMLDDAQSIASITGNFSSFVTDDFSELVQAHPRITFRIEHVGSVQFASQGVNSPDVKRFMQLARHDNICLLWAGFWKNSGDGFPYENTHEILEETYLRFGPDRIVWSGDGTRPNMLPGDYSSDLDFINTRLPFLSGADLTQILQHTAHELFKFGPEHGK